MRGSTSPANRGRNSNFARMGFTESDISELSDRLVDELVVWGGADRGEGRRTF
ncbi:MAG: hypothetical protein M3070_18170 [Actinomycetota bacterium]|nr:hypothetical protein [Actinomycetota bacterium]